MVIGIQITFLIYPAGRIDRLVNPFSDDTDQSQISWTAMRIEIGANRVEPQGHKIISAL